MQLALEFIRILRIRSLICWTVYFVTTLVRLVAMSSKLTNAQTALIGYSEQASAKQRRLHAKQLKRMQIQMCRADVISAIVMKFR